MDKIQHEKTAPSHDVADAADAADAADTLQHTQSLKSQIASFEEADTLVQLGYKPELKRNRSMFTLLFQSLAIAAIPSGEGGPFMSAIYGGGPLAIFVGWIVRILHLACFGPPCD
jgi:hypothetical protein